MKRTCGPTTGSHGLVLIVFGVILVLAPVVNHGIATAFDKQRIAEFYRHNPNNALLPAGLSPADYAGYDWSCFGIGVALASVGVGRTAQAGSAKPEAWANAEV